MTVLIAGATGHTGTEVRRQLGELGVPIRAMTRSERAAEQLRQDGIETIIADLNDPESLAPAVDGVRSIYLATSTSAALHQQEGNLARAAARAGVDHLVKLSVLVPEDPPQLFSQAHVGAEEAIKNSGLRWTILRGNTFMQTTLWWWTRQIPQGIVSGPVMDAQLSIVDMRDAAAVAVAALRDPDAHAGKTYAITGPEASSSRQQVAILSELLQKPVKAEELSIEQAKGMLLAGTERDDWTVDAVGELWQGYADGRAEAAVSPVVEQVTGRPPRNYREFARDHLTIFAGG